MAARTSRKFDCLPALKALGEEHRLRIIRLLIKKERSVNEIVTALKESQYNVSKHLKVLRDASLVEVTKHGQQRLYSLVPDFRSHLDANANVLDLGCCQFHFDKLPK